MGEFTIGYGKQTFDTSSDAVTVLALPAEPGTIWRAKGPITKQFSKLSSGNAVKASTDGYEGHGTWYTATYHSHQDRQAILTITLSRRVAKVPVAFCTLHVMPHDQAPHLCIKAQLTPNRLSRQGSEVAVFRGRGYIMDHVQLAELGIQISRQDISNFMDAEELGDEFEIETVSGSVDAAPTILRVERDDGSKSTLIVPPRPGRRVRVRDRD